MREEYDEIKVAPSTTSKGALHIPHDDGPLCEELLTIEAGKLRDKPVSAYPPGWREWCGTCLYIRQYGQLPGNGRFEVKYMQEIGSDMADEIERMVESLGERWGQVYIEYMNATGNYAVKDSRTGEMKVARGETLPDALEVALDGGFTEVR